LIAFIAIPYTFIGDCSLSVSSPDLPVARQSAESTGGDSSTTTEEGRLLAEDEVDDRTTPPASARETQGQARTAGGGGNAHVEEKIASMYRNRHE
jgi:hypothetical protein